MYKIILIVIIAALIVPSSAQASKVTEQQLLSGKIIKILKIGKIYFSKGDPALSLEYETDIDINDVASLRKEAEEIWPIFRVNVEKENMVNAIIKAREPKEKTGSITYKYDSYSFILKNKNNGTWHFYSWGRDYDREAKSIANKFLTSFKKRDISNAVQYIHYPVSFSKDQLDSEISGISKVLSIVSRKIGSINSYWLNDNQIFYRFFALQSASIEYWNKYPFFNCLIYDVKYSESGNGYMIFRFSIIKDKLVIHSILFGLPEDNPESENIFKELNFSIMKAFTDT